MYDSPKAAHFDAYFGEKKVGDMVEIGLKYRWIAARSVEQHITNNMHGNIDDNVIDNHLAEISSEFPVIIKRRY